MKLTLTIAIVGLLLAGCSGADQQSTTLTASESPTASEMQTANSAEPTTNGDVGGTQAASADEAVQRLKAAGLCEDPGEFDVRNVGDYFIAACGSPVPFMIADEPFAGRVANDWCGNASSLTKKTVMLVEGSTWAIIHPMPSEKQIRAIADAVGGKPARLSQVC